LVTSGDEILLKDSFLEKMLKAGLSEIMFSLEGPEKVHDYLVQYEGAYKIILKSLYELSLLKEKYKFNLVINTNINLINYRFLPKFIIKILTYFKVDIYHLQWLEYL
jgi:MoaA/NifB/PqqE/SkfB family radical SAM enzyme